MKRYVVLDKAVGETPLACAEAWRLAHPAYADVPLAYAGRLDPMASGKLLVLIGDECKHQTNYHELDKAYDFSALFGVESDSLDVLGRLRTCSLPRTLDGHNLEPTLLHDFEQSLRQVTNTLVGTIELPYPKFSAKTVGGKPLHVWTLEDRLDEIVIPTKTSMIYSLTFNKIEILNKADVVAQALEKVNSIPAVTDVSKALGNDFRRTAVREDWRQLLEGQSLPEMYAIAHFSCVASSGTYMRTLASEIAKKIGTCGLAWHIHRTCIGQFDNATGMWHKLYQ